MPREKGSKNLSNYKYSVDDGVKKNYFITQKDIEREYNLKRTAIYFMMNKPDKRKEHKGLIIKKLEKSLPVYKINKIINDDSININYEKIIY